MESGIVPEFGAIFMSNRRTRQECFDRKLFGLPYPFADFVQAVKAGMVLFLFEYENKNLYGVFEAVSDGAMDIVPHAYSSSGKKFPAQVRFSVIWNCGPLPEREFRDAIVENYYEANKFHFGLSKEQVYSLLWLFESRKVRVQKSPMGKSKKHCSRSFLKVKPSVDSGKLNPDKGASRIDSEASKSAAVPCSSRSESVALHNKTEQVDVSSCGDTLGVEDYIPLSYPESPEPLKDPSDNYPKVKVMYSDLRNKKASVFSRLNLVPEVVEENKNSDTKATVILPRLESVSKGTAQEKQSKPEVGKSVHEIMERLLQRQENWATNIKEAKRNVPANDSRSLNKRSNVFSRLKFPLEPAIKEEDVNAKLDETLNKIIEIIKGKKKKRSLEENYADEQKVDTTILVEMIEDASRAEVSKYPYSRGRTEKLAKFLNYEGETVKEWSETEANDSKNVSMSGCMSDELNKKKRLRSSRSKNESSDVKSIVCENVEMPSEGSSAGKENCGSCVV